MYTDKKLKVLSPSQWTNFLWIVLGIADVLFIHMFLLAALAVVKFLYVYYWRYEINERTIVERKGILDVTRNEIHYFRIKSIRVEEPLWMRLFNLSNVFVKTSDPYLPELKLYAVPSGTLVREELRSMTHNRRKEENVREFDMYNL
jgi:membrane protein YdbS with pleckstrin-like domain